MSIPWTKPTNLNIKWDNGSNKPATPLTEILQEEFLKSFFCYPWMVDGLNYGGYASLPNSNDADPKYTWQYYFFHKKALAIATRYMNSKRDQGFPATGVFISNGELDGNGYDVHFYKLGCLHPNMKTQWVKMHDREDVCADCGFKANYDTSG